MGKVTVDLRVSFNSAIAEEKFVFMAQTALILISVGREIHDSTCRNDRLLIFLGIL
jgi:hypothetical protein